MKLADKCLEKFLMLFFWTDWVRKLGKKCGTTHTFLCTINIQLLHSIQIVALRSVNNFQKSYDFAANSPWFCIINTLPSHQARLDISEPDPSDSPAAVGWRWSRPVLTFSSSSSRHFWACSLWFSSCCSVAVIASNSYLLVELIQTFLSLFSLILQLL
jgi:hypothetical protein